jgi:DNA-binding NarL/FixJ family response regulator
MNLDPKVIRVLVMDDHAAVREALATTLQAADGVESVGDAYTTEAAWPILREKSVDVAVVEIALRDANGLVLIRDLRTQFPRVEVVVYSYYDEELYAERAMAVGATGYLMKSESTQRVLDAVRSVVAGEVFLSPRMSSRILGKVARQRTAGTPFAIRSLSNREMAVFQMMGEGLGVDQIMGRLHLSRKTVETHRRGAKKKLGFATVDELLCYAVQWTYGDRGDPVPKDDPGV